MEPLPTTVAALTQLVQQLYTENQSLKQRINELELKLRKHRIDPPPIVKLNAPGDKSASKRQQRVKAYVRQRSIPDQVQLHAYSHCPHCQTPVTGNAIAYEREIIDLPPVKPVVTLHRVLKRHCMGCGAWVTPQVDFSDQVVGQSRFGVRLTSLVVTLRERGRLPIRVIRALLQYLTQLSLSNGQIVAMSHQIATKGNPLYQQLQAKLQASAVVHADETGHRENGHSGYVWNFTTPQVRYYAYRLSRGKAVVTEVLGENYEGILTFRFLCCLQSCQYGTSTVLGSFITQVNPNYPNP